MESSRCPRPRRQRDGCRPERRPRRSRGRRRVAARRVGEQRVRPSALCGVMGRRSRRDGSRRRRAPVVLASTGHGGPHRAAGRARPGCWICSRDGASWFHRRRRSSGRCRSGPVSCPPGGSEGDSGPGPAGPIRPDADRRRLEPSLCLAPALRGRHWCCGPRAARRCLLLVAVVRLAPIPAARGLANSDVELTRASSENLNRPEPPSWRGTRGWRGVGRTTCPLGRHAGPAPHRA